MCADPAGLSVRRHFSVLCYCRLLTGLLHTLVLPSTGTIGTIEGANFLKTGTLVRLSQQVRDSELGQFKRSLNKQTGHPIVQTRHVSNHP